MNERERKTSAKRIRSVLFSWFSLSRGETVKRANDRDQRTECLSNAIETKNHVTNQWEHTHLVCAANITISNASNSGRFHTLSTVTAHSGFSRKSSKKKQIQTKTEHSTKSEIKHRIMERKNMCDLSRMNGRMTITSWLARARIAHTRKMHWKHVYRRLFDFTSILCLKYFCAMIFYFLFLSSFAGFCVVALVVYEFLCFLFVPLRIVHRMISTERDWAGKKIAVKSYDRIEQSAILRCNDVSFCSF